jgi:hypothetical protein
VKAGKVAFKVDKAGIVHASIGRVSFAPKQTGRKQPGTSERHHQGKTIFR